MIWSFFFSRSKCISSVSCVLHISQCVCLLSMLSFSVPVLALNHVVVAAELSYKSCSLSIISLYFL